MEVILNPENIKKRKVITYEEVKEGQCFVCDVDLGKDYPPVWIKTDRPLDNKQSCTLLTCGSRWYDIGRTGYFTEKTPVVLVNMICIATFDYEE